MKKIILGFILALLLLLGGKVSAQTSPVGMASSRTSINGSLDLGSKGDAVTILQEFLIAKGYLYGTASTGYYGAMTRAAVLAFQGANNLPQVGRVGPMTLAIVNVQLSANDSVIVNPSQTGSGPCSGGAVYNSVTGAPCTSLVQQASSASIDTISVSAPNVTVTGKNLNTVKVYAYGSGTGITSGTFLGNATLQSTTLGEQSWSYQPAQGLYTQIYAQGFDAQSTLVGTLTLSIQGATAIYNALWGGSTTLVPNGCISNQGYSGTTGLPCNNPVMSSTSGGNMTGCATGTTYSTMTGQLCSTITSSSTSTSQIIVTDPQAGATWSGGQFVSVTWTSQNLAGGVYVQLCSVSTPGLCTSIVNGLGYNTPVGNHTVTVQLPSSGGNNAVIPAMVKVTSDQSPNVYGYSSAFNVHGWDVFPG